MLHQLFCSWLQVGSVNISESSHLHTQAKHYHVFFRDIAACNINVLKHRHHSHTQYNNLLQKQCRHIQEPRLEPRNCYVGISETGQRRFSWELCSRRRKRDMKMKLSTAVVLHQPGEVTSAKRNRLNPLLVTAGSAGLHAQSTFP